MTHTLPTDPTAVHHDAPTADVLAHAALALDEVVVAGQHAAQKWELTQRALSVMVLSIMIYNPPYRLTPVVREALGGNFYESTLLAEAEVLGWIKPNHTHSVTDSGPSVSTEYEVTDLCPWNTDDLYEAIAKVGSV